MAVLAPKSGIIKYFEEIVLTETTSVLGFHIQNVF